MKKLMNAQAIALTVMLAAAPAAEARPAPGETATIKAAVEQFRTAIVDKDADRFFATLYDRKTPWIGALGDGSWQKALASKPDGKREFSSDPADFIHWVTTSQFPIEERFGRIDIKNDDAVALVSFDYGFYVKGRMTNAGLETWSLARTAAGWKIVSIVYSVNNTK